MLAGALGKAPDMSSAGRLILFHARQAATRCRRYSRWAGVEWVDRLTQPAQPTDSASDAGVVVVRLMIELLCMCVCVRACVRVCVCGVYRCV